MPNPVKWIGLAITFTAFDIIYVSYFREIAALYLINYDSKESIINFLDFQFLINFFVLPVIWIFCVGVVHLTAEVFGGKGSFRVFLFQSSLIVVPLFFLIFGVSLYFIPRLESHLLMNVTKQTSLRDISQLIKDSGHLTVINIVFNSFYFIAFLWIIIRIQRLYRLNIFVSICALIFPFLIIYLFTVFL